ncbi:MAG: hypothetical protein AB7U61_17450 [Methylocystis sp.]
MKLLPFDEDNALRMVVETPRGSGVKLAYDTKARVFIAKRALAIGVSYPFDGLCARYRSFETAGGISEHLKHEIAQFFVSTTFFIGKGARVELARP